MQTNSTTQQVYQNLTNGERLMIDNTCKQLNSEAVHMQNLNDNDEDECLRAHTLRTQDINDPLRIPTLTKHMQ